MPFLPFPPRNPNWTHLPPPAESDLIWGSAQESHRNCFQALPLSGMSFGPTDKAKLWTLLKSLEVGKESNQEQCEVHMLNTYCVL